MQSKRTVFPHRVLPYLLLLPQMAVTIVFFLWPAGQTAWQSMLREDPFGLKTTFIWFDNYGRLFRDLNYLSSFGVTGIFALCTAIVSIEPYYIVMSLKRLWENPAEICSMLFRLV